MWENKVDPLIAAAEATDNANTAKGYYQEALNLAKQQDDASKQQIEWLQMKVDDSRK